jgi:hypothetical protein
MVLSKAKEYLLQVLIEPVLWDITVILSRSMRLQNSDITPSTSQLYIRHSITNILHSAVDIILWCTKICLYFMNLLLLNRWNYNPLSVRLLLIPSDLLRSNYVHFATSLVIFLSHPDLHWFLTCQISFTFSLHYVAPKYLPGSETLLST